MRNSVLISILVFSVLFLVLLFGVFRSFKTEADCIEMMETDILNSTEIDFDSLRNVTIFFGHQSVGQDIVLGMAEHVTDDGRGIPRIVESSTLDDLESGTLVHCNIGRNTRPLSKILAFKRALARAVDVRVDIALMKFCYVDVTHDSNPQEIFDAYSEAISELKDEFPETVFVHVTVPIEAMPQSAEGVAKHFIKRVIGRPGVVEDNWVRHQYNVLLRAHYSGKEPVFDLAEFESRDAAGCATVRMFQGEGILFMDPEKTEDGGHLNLGGRTTIGRELLAFLGAIASERELKE